MIAISGQPIELAKQSPLLKELNLANQRLLAKDETLWGESATNDALNRLGWIDLPSKSLRLLTRLDAVAAQCRKNAISRIILCGMGGSSLAAEVIAASQDQTQIPLTIVDSTDPADLLLYLNSDLSTTLFIFASKSGGTIETNSHRALFHAELLHQNLSTADHMLVITDSQSSLEDWAKSNGVPILNGFTDVGGRYSALSAFGIAAAAISGIDVSLLLDDAREICSELAKPNNPAVLLALAIYESRTPFISLPELPLSHWIEQLIAESTGKDGTGILPIIEKSRTAIPKILRFDFDSTNEILDNNEIQITTSLGAQFLLWEWSTALLCYLLKVNPFDQPNVALAKERANRLLASEITVEVPLSINHLEKIKDLLAKIDSSGYLGILAYLPRSYETQVSALAQEFRKYLKLPITVGWGPRYLHSTGQFHKGGVATGSFLILTHESDQDLSIPGQSFSFAQLQLAQAFGDIAALQEGNLNLLHLSLANNLTLMEISQSLHEAF